MTNSEPPNQNNEIIEDGNDLKRWFFLLWRHWYWFLVFVIMGTFGAYMYSKYQHRIYRVDTSIIVPKTNTGIDLNNLFAQSISGGSNLSINNEIELLRSYTLHHKVLENLNWRTSWYLKRKFHNILGNWSPKMYSVWDGLYFQEPFMVHEADGKNVKNIKIYISPGIDNQYQIRVNGTAGATEINFSDTGTFGQPFKNEYFNFTLEPRIDLDKVAGKEYYFTFQETNDLIFSYLGRINIELTDNQSEVIKLSLSGVEPLREIHYLNELIRVYLDLKLDLQTKTQKRSLEFIDAQLLGISDSLGVAENTFTEFRSKNQIIDLSAQGELVMNQLSDIEKEKSQYQMQLEYFKNLQNYLEKAESIQEIATPSVVGIGDPSLNALVLKLGELYTRREVLSFSAHENNPTLVLLNKEFEQVHEQLSENLVNLIDNAALSISSLEDRHYNISSQLNNLPGKEQELINIRRHYELTSEIYTFLLQRRAEIEIALAATVVDIQIVDPARMERIVRTGKSLNAMIIRGALLGLLIPIILIFLLDFFNNTIRLQEDVERLTPIAILGNILHSASNLELAVDENPRSPISESFRTIRTNLQYKFTQPGQKVIGIHSISSSEGKTFISTNLATILAINEKKVLLVGADLRQPRLHKIFEISNETGLSNFLAGQASEKEIILPTKIENLWLTPSGPIPPNPAELLERQRFSAFIEKAKEEFDFIIIDNAPVSIVTDGLITCRTSELNLIILRYGVSRKDQLKYINEMERKGVMGNTGLLINDIKLGKRGYGYSYNYRYGYGYGYGKGYTS